MSQPEPLSLTELLAAGAGVGRAIGMADGSLVLDDLADKTRAAKPASIPVRTHAIVVTRLMYIPE